MVKISEQMDKSTGYLLHKVPLWSEMELNFYMIIFVLNLLMFLHSIMRHDPIVQHKKFQGNRKSIGEASFKKVGKMSQFP